MNIKSNIIIGLLLSFLIGCIWSTEEDSSGVTGTGNNGVIAVSIKDNTVLQQAKRQALAANELLNITVSLYKESDPTKVVATQTESQDGRYLFSNVDYDTYAVRVDINQEKGGLEKGIVVNSGEIVPVVITINIYITQNITNIIQGNDPVYIDSILNAYNASLLEQLENGDYILKTVSGELEKVVIKQGETRQELELSSVPLSSNVTVSSSSGIAIQKIEFVLNNENSKDAVITTSSSVQNHNFGQAQAISIGSYDRFGTNRFLVYFDLPSVIDGKEILSASIKYYVYKWVKKSVEPLKWKGVAHQVMVSWEEGSGNDGKLESLGEINSASVNGVTANMRWFGKSWLNPFELDDVEIKKAYFTLAEMETNIDSEWILDITKVVQLWVGNENENFGILIRDLNDYLINQADFHTHPFFYTSEHESKKPIVTIEYQ